MLERTRIIAVFLVMTLFAFIGAVGFLLGERKSSGQPARIIEPTSQVSPQVSSLQGGTKGKILEIEKEGLTIETGQGKKESFLFATPRVYLLFRNRPGVKAKFEDLTRGQIIEFEVEKDTLGQLRITKLVIEE